MLFGKKKDVADSSEMELVRDDSLDTDWPYDPDDPDDDGLTAETDAELPAEAPEEDLPPAVSTAPAAPAAASVPASPVVTDDTGFYGPAEDDVPEDLAPELKPSLKSRLRGALIPDFILLLACAALTFGIYYVFPACEDEGLTCRYAQNVIMCLGGIMMLQSFLALVIWRRGTRYGFRVSVLLEAALVLAVPVFLIDLCDKATARCNLLMRPVVIVLGTVIVICALVGIFTDRKKKKPKAA